MAETQPTNKSLAIIGSGADMATGNLLYKFGGIDLSMLAKLQEKGVNTYDNAVKELRDVNEELYFYTPRHRVTVKESQISSVDGLLLVITPPPSASDLVFSSSMANRLKESAQLFVEKKAIVLMTIPEGHDWSESTYNSLLQGIKSRLQRFGIATESVHLIPSDAQGQNFMELSSKTPWYTNATLIAALDEVFS